MTLKLVHDASNVSELPVDNYKDIAHCARKFAERLESGEYEGINRVAIVLDTPDGVLNEYWGATANGLEIVGLLEVGKLNLFRANDDGDD